MFLEPSLQMFFHLPLLSYNISRFITDSKAWNNLCKLAEFWASSKELLPDLFYQEISDVKNLEKEINLIENRADLLSSVLTFYHKHASKNPCDCPICRIFLLKGRFYINENEHGVFNANQFVLSNMPADVLVQSTENAYLYAENTPLSICVKLSRPDIRIFDFKDFSTVFLREYEDYTAKYSLMLLLAQNQKNEFFCFKVHDKLLYLLHPDGSKLASDAKECRDLQLCYLIYHKNLNEYNRFMGKKILGCFLLNLFLNQNFLESFKPALKWKKDIYNNFCQLLASFPTRDRYNSELIKLAKFEAFSEAFLRISSSIYSCKKIEYNELIEEFLNEMHIGPSDIKDDCELCSLFFVRENANKILNSSRYKITVDPNKLERHKAFFTMHEQSLNKISKNEFHKLVNMNLYIDNTNTISEFTPSKYLLVSTEAFQLDSLSGINSIVSLEIKFNKVLFYYNLIGILYQDTSSDEVNYFSLNYDLRWKKFVGDKQQTFDSFESAIMSSLDSKPILLTYAKDISKINYYKPAGTKPILMSNQSNDLCYINAAIQALFSFKTFHNEIAAWQCSIPWATLIRDFAKSDMEIKADTKNLKIFKQEFNKALTEEEKKHHGQFMKMGSAVEFMKIFLEKIHEASDCPSSYICPTCSHFLLEGHLVKLSNGVKQGQKIQFKQNSILQHCLGDQMLPYIKDGKLSSYNNMVYKYELKSAPKCLIIELKGSNGADQAVAEKIKTYILSNLQFQFPCGDEVFDYSLKSIIFYKSEHFVCMIYSRFYQKWMLVNDDDAHAEFTNLRNFYSSNIYNNTSPMCLIFLREERNLRIEDPPAQVSTEVPFNFFVDRLDAGSEMVINFTSFLNSSCEEFEFSTEGFLTLLTEFIPYIKALEEIGSANSDNYLPKNTQFLIVSLPALESMSVSNKIQRFIFIQDTKKTICYEINALFYYHGQSAGFCSEFGAICKVYIDGKRRTEYDSIDSLVNKGYVPAYGFYSKKRYFYMLTILTMLREISGFSTELQSIDSQSSWVKSLTQLITLEITAEGLLDFVIITADYNTSYDYDINHAFLSILSRLHLETCYHSLCPSCKLFLYKGTCQLLSSINSEINELSNVSIKNYLKCGLTNIIHKNVLSCIILNESLKEVHYELTTLPQYLVYTLYYETEEASDQEIFDLCGMYLNNNESFLYENKNGQFGYRASFIIFHVRNFKDRYYYAVFDYNESCWRINGEVIDGSAYSTLNYILLRENKCLFFPAIIIYQRY